MPKTIDKLLTDLDACEEAREWAAGKTLAVAWRTCERSDWMLWLVGRRIGCRGWPTLQELVLATWAAARAARAAGAAEHRAMCDLIRQRLSIPGCKAESKG